MKQLVEIRLDKIDSTNTYAKQHFGEFAHDKVTCITAEEQTAGRGRFQRVWHAPRGKNILATFAFRLPAEARHLISLAQVMTLSFTNVLLQEDLLPKIKWPNDVQLNGKKLAGVLCETSFHQSQADIFLGIGINVNMDADELARIGQPATSLKVETNREWSRTDLLKKLQKQFLADLVRFETEGFTPFHSEFENLLAYRGQPIRCFDGQKEWSGICHSLTFDGQLNLFLPNKTMHTIRAGDITPGM